MYLAIYSGGNMSFDLHNTIDAKRWASEFAKQYPILMHNGDAIYSEDIMLGWFANAIMAGYDYKIPTVIPSNEICICAAVKTECGKIIRGHRHFDCIRSINERDLKIAYPSNEAQGFITSLNRFVSRTEGRKLQDQAGLLSVAKDGFRSGTLFSEDLY